MEVRSTGTSDDAEREAASAWLDGQAELASLSALLASGTARSAFADHAAVSDALRASCPKSSHAAFLSALHQRIERESITIEQAASQSQTAQRLTSFGAAGSPADAAAPRREPAANDSRWRLVAGVAGFAAVASLAFGGWQAQRAATAGAQLAALQSANPRAAVARASTASEQIVLVNGEPRVMLRDPRLAELVAQHRQLGGGVHHTQAGFFRASTLSLEPNVR